MSDSKRNGAPAPEAIMNINCFTFSPLMGMMSGIKLNIDSPKAGGGMHPPHVSVGEHFIAIDTAKKPVWHEDRLMSTKLRHIDASGKSFNVFSKAEDTSAIMVMVDLKSVPEGVKRKLDPSVVNAWVYYETDGNLIIRDQVGGKAIIEFTKVGQSATIFDADGSVHRIVRQDGKVVIEPLPIVEQAKERERLYRFLVKQYREQVAAGRKEIPIKEVSITRLHGILGGISRLLQVVVRHNRDAANVLIDFLTDFVGPEMPAGLRKSIESLLRANNFSQAVMFVDGISSPNVLPFKKGCEDDASKKRADAERKRQARIANDRLVRDAMKGRSSGGSDKKKGG